MAINFLSGIDVDNGVLYTDTANNRVGVNQTSPIGAVHILGPNTNPAMTTSALVVEQGDGAKILIDGNDIDAAAGMLYLNDYSTNDVVFGGQIRVGGGGSPVGNSWFANGNVGVGTTSPTSKLHVAQDQNNTFSTAIAWTASANDVLNITNNNSTDTNNYASLYMRADGSSGSFSSRIVARNTTAGTGELHFQLRDSAHTANTETKLMIDSGGNVGIGTTSPSHPLTIVSSYPQIKIQQTGQTPSFTFGSGSGYAVFDGIGTSGSLLDIRDDGTSRMRIDASGNVGIGTTSPSQKLDVAGDATFDGRIYTNATALASVGILGKAIANGWAARYDSNNANYSGFYFDANNDASMVLRDDAGNMNVYLRSDSTSYLNGGNVGIGTTSPQEKLHVQNYTTGESHQAMFKGGAVTVGDYSYISLNNGYGTEYNKEVRLAAVAELGASNKTGFAILTSPDSSGASGHERLRVTADGDVGIGTTSPSTKLHALGTSISMPALGAAPSAAQFGGSSYGTLFSTLTTGRGVIQQGRVDGTATSYDLLLQPVGGNVGIGTTSSSYTLDVTGTGRFTGDMHLGRYIFHNGDTNTWMGFPTNDTISFRTNNSDRMYINSSGNVGVGTTNPQRKFHVNGIARIEANAQTLDLVGTDHTFIGFYPDGAAAGRKAYIGFPGATSNRLTIANEFNDDISFFTNGSEKVTIENSGDVGIGTTSPTSPLHIQKTLSGGQVMAYFDGTVGPSTYGALGVRVNNIDYGTGMRFYRSGIYDSGAIGFINGTSTVGSININTSSTSYNTTSDYRLKENLTEITDGIDRIKQLKPKRFNFIGDTSIVDGFIAHEAKQVVPEAVTGEKDEVLPNGDPVYQGIDQAKIVPLLTAALQEAITKIEVLENRLQILENK